MAQVDAIAAVHHRIQARAAAATDELVAAGVPDRRGPRLGAWIRAELARHQPAVDAVLPDLDTRLGRRSPPAACRTPWSTATCTGQRTAGRRGRRSSSTGATRSLGNPAFDVLRLTGHLDAADRRELVGAWAARWRADAPGCRSGAGCRTGRAARAALRRGGVRRVPRAHRAVGASVPPRRRARRAGRRCVACGRRAAYGRWMTDAGSLRERLRRAAPRRGGRSPATTLDRRSRPCPARRSSPTGSTTATAASSGPATHGSSTGAYRNDALVTKLADGIPVSSSSQPSLMALMIEELDMRPGMRVLEIGAGTGYNAALMAAHRRRRDQRRRAARRRRAGGRGAGDGRRRPHARVVAGDGYLGVPGGAPYDRVIVTVGDRRRVAALAGAARAGRARAGPGRARRHTTRSCGSAARPPTARCDRRLARCLRRRVHGGGRPAGRRATRGRIRRRSAARRPSRPRGHGAAPAGSPPLRHAGYRDLWFAVGVWDRRATCGPVRARHGLRAAPTRTGAGGAAIRADGAIGAAGPHADATRDRRRLLLDRWIARGRPGAAEQWRATMVLAGDPDAADLVPRRLVLA